MTPIFWFFHLKFTKQSKALLDRAEDRIDRDLPGCENLSRPVYATLRKCVERRV